MAHLIVLKINVDEAAKAKVSIDWSEGMAPETVIDCLDRMSAVLKRQYAGKLVVPGGPAGLPKRGNGA